mmetsp:Transcript_12065/g.26343  ORF Transcript_12065/g.26343 Transcript_12065/m.26343 type:complete len:325 (-) Transcript_12065:579-1553(-)
MRNAQLIRSQVVVIAPARIHIRIRHVQKLVRRHFRRREQIRPHFGHRRAFDSAAFVADLDRHVLFSASNDYPHIRNAIRVLVCFYRSAHRVLQQLEHREEQVAVDVRKRQRRRARDFHVGRVAVMPIRQRSNGLRRVENHFCWRALRIDDADVAFASSRFADREVLRNQHAHPDARRVESVKKPLDFNVTRVDFHGLLQLQNPSRHELHDVLVPVQHGRHCIRDGALRLRVARPFLPQQRAKAAFVHLAHLSHGAHLIQPMRQRRELMRSMREANRKLLMQKLRRQHHARRRWMHSKLKQRAQRHGCLRRARVNRKRLDQFSGA